jgi:hypothetical protein
MKKCIKCEENKTTLEFNKAKVNKDGLKGICIICEKKYKKEYRLNNAEKIRKTLKEYYLNNSEKIKETSKLFQLNNLEKTKSYRKKYILNNIDRKRINNRLYNKKRRENEPLFKLSGNTRTLIHQSFTRNGYTKNSKTFKILGCTFIEFKNYLENKFTKDMSWENQGKWHLDHIYPISLAKDEEHLIQLNHYSNFQPLWAIDNFKKGNKVIYKQ